MALRGHWVAPADLRGETTGLYWQRCPVPYVEAVQVPKWSYSRTGSKCGGAPCQHSPRTPTLQDGRHRPSTRTRRAAPRSQTVFELVLSKRGLFP